jgi:hypothetical protein
MSSSPLSEIQRLHSLCSCPVSFEPLVQAVTLFPCCHKVSLAVAKTLYGEVKDGECLKRNQVCCMCRTPVTTYHDDHLVRDIAQLALQLSEQPTVKVVQKTRLSALYYCKETNLIRLHVEQELSDKSIEGVSDDFSLQETAHILNALGFQDIVKEHLSSEALVNNDRPNRTMFSVVILESSHDSLSVSRRINILARGDIRAQLLALQ